MVAGIEKFLLNQTERSIASRSTFWHPDFSSWQGYENSVASNRAKFLQIIGVVDRRLPVRALEFDGSTAGPAQVAETDLYTVHAVRWRVFEGVFGEGLWLRPKTAPLARVVAIPDAEQAPELVVGLAPGLPLERQFARRLAENGCEVLVPVLIDRQDTWSGNATLNRFTNQPHREWIYRQAFELGRHIIGYEVQKILAALDFFALENSSNSPSGPPPEQSANPAIHLPHFGAIGYAEGGLLALYVAAVDTRLEATLVSGYFDSRQRLWEEPIYRNVFGLLREFGDAEIAGLIAPRALTVEHSASPTIDGPPKPHDGRSGAAPGKIHTPDYQSAEGEFERARALVGKGTPGGSERFKLICGTEGMTTGPLSDRALIAFLNELGIAPAAGKLKAPGPAPTDARRAFNPADREQRQVKELEAFTQKLLRESERVREEFFWKASKGAAAQEWLERCSGLRSNLWEDVIGRLPESTIPSQPRSTKVSDHPKWTQHEVVLDVYPDVFAWGYLLVPKDLKPGERRPVVVCQHGLEGLPSDVLDENRDSKAFQYYHAYAARLAERGFVVFAPHNPYRGGDRFRRLQRLANPLGKSLFSIIIAQHARVIDWLSEQPFVDPKRIAFYGLSYGGKTAMRVPAVLDGYALSICSADFNDWVSKNVSVDFPASYMFLGEYELPEFNLGSTFNYAEMAGLIAPRPFMVERGHDDGVGNDEWVAFEYAKVRRLYDRLGIGNRTAIEFFNGGHMIHGEGTFEFLHQHLDWSKPKE
jgi:dienelactone hydrolase